MAKDFYSILGVNRNASKNQIKKSYHKLGLESYPEIDMSSIAYDRFRALTQAFSVLSDTQLRNIYDHFGEEGLNETQKAAINGSGDHTFKEFFEQVFNNKKIKSEKPIKSSISHSINDSKVDSKVFINNFFVLK
jgi:DnaJ-class molecular chaperone